MLANGVDGRVVMDILGWSRLEMVSRYQHVSTALQEEAARRMNELLFEDQAPSSDTPVTNQESAR